MKLMLPYPILLVLFLVGPWFALAQSVRQPEVLADKTDGLRTPFSVVVEPDGGILGVEYEKGNRVFRIAPDGDVSFVAGTFRDGRLNAGATEWGDDSPATNAHFNGMHDLVRAANGDLYIADTFNARVRRIEAASGNVSTLIGPEDGLASPHTVDVHPNGDLLLVTDLKHRVVREYSFSTGELTIVAGNGKRGQPVDGEPAIEQPLIAPRAAIYGAWCGHDIWIASREGNALRHVRDGIITTVVNRSGKKGKSGDGGPAVDARLSGPKHLALDAAGNVIITDDNNHCIRLYRVADKTIHTVAGINGTKGDRLGTGPTDTLLNRPHGARMDPKGRLLVADSMNHRVLRFDFPKAEISVTESEEAIVIRKGEQHVLTYHKAMVPPPKGAAPAYTRSGFIHPLTAPDGTVVTTAHPEDHTHHVGLWHAWVKTKHKGRAIDFWNLKAKQGTVRFAEVEEMREDGFTVIQEHVILPNEVILRERFSIDAKLDEDGNTHLDYRTEQTNVSEAPLELPAYRYGGPLAWRGPAHWDADTSKILTSAGKTRADGHATRADWAQFSGPDAAGREEISVTLICHPDNHDAPQRQRIWPRESHNGAIFYNWVPIQEHGWAIQPEQVSVMRYRIVLSASVPSKEAINEWHKQWD